MLLNCFTLVVHWENAHTQKVLFSGHFLFPAPRIVGCKCGGSRKCLKNINTRSQPAGMQLGGGFFFPTANSRTQRGERAGKKIKERQREREGGGIEGDDGKGRLCKQTGHLKEGGKWVCPAGTRLLEVSSWNLITSSKTTRTLVKRKLSVLGTIPVVRLRCRAGGSCGREPAVTSYLKSASSKPMISSTLSYSGLKISQNLVLKKFFPCPAGSDKWQTFVSH